MPFEEAAEYLLEAPTDILNELIEKESIRKIKEAIKRLDDTYRLVFEFKLVHQLPDEDIGNILGISAKSEKIRENIYFGSTRHWQPVLRCLCWVSLQ